MSGVFLSYSRSDRALAEQIIQGLRVLGIDVWWDEDMPGVDWQDELERQIGELAGVVVLWTANSSASKNVKDEARLGLKSEKLVNVLAGAAEPPFPFDRVNGLPLDGWTGCEPHHGWARVVQTIESLIVKAGGAEPGQITGALTRREQALRLARESVDEAEHGFQDAQAREAEATEAATAIAATVARAADQLQRMVEMGVSSAVMRTVQQELDDAQSAREGANQAHRAAKTALSEASRGLTRAKAALERLVSNVAASPAEPIQTIAPETRRPAKVSEPREEPMPGPTPSPAMVRAADGPVRPTKSAKARWLAPVAIVIAAVLISPVVLLIGGFLLHAVMSLRSINGNWRLDHTSCAHTIKIAVDGDTLSVGEDRMKMAAARVSDRNFDAVPANGPTTHYLVDGDGLWVNLPDGTIAHYLRCPG